MSERAGIVILECPEVLEVSQEFIDRLRDDRMASDRLVAAAERARLQGQIAVARGQIGPQATDRQIAQRLGLGRRVVRRARRGGVAGALARLLS